jgi:hypothetical protein
MIILFRRVVPAMTRVTALRKLLGASVITALAVSLFRLSASPLVGVTC